MRSTCLWTFAAALWLLLGVEGLLDPAGAQKVTAKKPAAKADSRNLAEFIAPDFCAALVVHPGRLMKSAAARGMPSGGAPALASGAARAAPGAKVLESVDPQKLRRVVILIDPTPMADSPISPAVILQFEEDTDSKALLSKEVQDIESVDYQGKTYLRSQSAGKGDVAGAAYIAGPRTLLLAPEPTLKKMLTAGGEPRPLLEQLRRTSLNNDLIIEVFAPPLIKLMGEAAKPAGKQGPSPSAMATAMLEEIKSASLTFNLSGDTLLQLTIVGAKNDSADKLHGQLSLLQMMIAGAGAKQPEEKAAPGPAGALADLSQQLLKDLQVTKQEDRVVVTLPMPKDFTELVKKFSETAKEAAPFGLPGAAQEKP